MTSAARWLLVVLTACSVARAAMVCGQVICTTDGGHVAIEAPHQPGHCPQRDSHDEPGRHDSGPCEDRPAAGRLALQAPHRPTAQVSALDLVHTSPVTALPALKPCATALAATHAPAPPGETSHLRTVVLLI